MSENDRKDSRLGEEKHRAGEGEGFRAPMVEEEGEVIQSSMYDGTGNEIVVATGVDSEGNRKQGTGESAEEAIKDIEESDETLGKGFGTGRH